MTAFGVVLLGYLLGAIPFGALLGWLRGVDVRRYGSGRTGTANVLRTLGAKAAAAVFLGDLAKGLAAVLLARLITHSPAVEAAAGLAAMAGHNWPVYLGFRGGRGVVTGFGGLILLSWPASLIALAGGLSTIALWRYVSLGSMVGAVASALGMIPLAAAGWEPSPYLIYSLGGAALIVFQHRDNLARLMNGTERKLGQPATRQQDG